MATYVPRFTDTPGRELISKVRDPNTQVEKLDIAEMYLELGRYKIAAIEVCERAVDDKTREAWTTIGLAMNHALEVLRGKSR